MLKASDMMNRFFLTVTPDMGVEELARLFTRQHVSGAVVVDKKGRLLGVVTEGDLIAKEKNLHLPTVVSIFDAVVYLESSEHFKEELHRMLASQVEDIYTRDPVTIASDSVLSDIATLMTEDGVHFLPVMDGGHVVGVVGRREVIRALASIE
ncbi:MAG: CBS domain-containing protein [bacterium]|nr:MAG: CBS domain-containing protein [bacterium]